MLIDLRELHLRRNFDARTLQRAHNYFREDRVLVVREVDPETLAALVAGTARDPYTLSVDCFADGGSVVIEADCSCPVGFNCKHAAAALYHYLQRRHVDPGNSAAVGVWLHRLAEANADTKPGLPDKRVRYLFSLDFRYGAELQLKTQQVQRRANGQWAKPRDYSLSGRSTARFVRDCDRTIGALLQYSTPSGVSRLTGSAGALILRLALETGFAYWQDEDADQAFSLGPTRNSRLCFELLPDGRQRIAAQAPDIDRVLPLSPPWYLDLEAGLCGPLDTDLDAKLASSLAQAPLLAAKDCARVETAMKTLGPAAPSPLQLAVTEVNDLQPEPCVHLCMGPPQHGVGYRSGLYREPRLELRFDYANIMVGGSQPPVVTQVHDTRLRRIHRNTAYEAHCVAHLEELGFHRVYAAEPGSDQLLARDPARVFPAFMSSAVPRLEKEGWRFTVDDHFSYRLATVQAWNLAAERHDQDWFSLSLDVIVDGQRIPLLRLIKAALQRDPALAKLDHGAPLCLRLDDGRLLLVPAERLHKIWSIVLELVDQEGARLHRSRAPIITDLADAGFDYYGDDALQALARRLADFSGIQAVRPPSGLKAQLRPYQRDGLNWLHFLAQYGFGGILADDMGLGKTVQVLAWLLNEIETGRATGPSLVVAPTSVTSTWMSQAKSFAPGLDCLLLQGPQRHARFSEISDTHLVVTSYALIRRDFEQLARIGFHALILDESQYIKNPRSDSAKKLGQISARHRFCLTGTPLENNLGELWSQFHFLQPGMLGDIKQFRKNFRTPIEKRGDARCQQSLNRRIKPFLLRRSKDKVATELPPCTEITQWIDLQGAQRDLYESIRVTTFQSVQTAIAERGLARSHIAILDALLKLRQVCCDPRLLKLDAARGVRQSGKMAQLLDMLIELVAEGRRILLFSQFTQMLALIEPALKEADIAYIKLTGRSRNRDRLIDAFQNGEAPLFLISLKAGGTGLNLTRADTVIHYDPWWNPAVERQATDRAYRIGQDKPVFVYRLMCRGTVEEKINRLQMRKQALADSLFAGASDRAGALRAEDLEVLFEPLA